MLDLKNGIRSGQQTEIGKLGLETDEGGHLIATRFNGPPDAFNIVPQDANLNRGQWKAMENEWAEALKDGQQTEVIVAPVYADGISRPIGFDVLYTIGTGNKTITKSFYNERQDAL